MGERPDQIRGDSSFRDPDVRNRGTEEVVGRAADAVVRDTPDETARIRSEIVRTRGDMSETIDAIQDKLSPRNLAAQARESVKEATVGRVRQAAASVGDAASNVAEQTRDVAAEVAETVKRNPWPALLIGAGSAWLVMGQRKKDAAARRSFTQREYREDGSMGYYDVERGRGSRPGASAANAMSRASSQVQNLLQRNPLAVGAVAAAVGVAVGLVLPETDRENRLMGETRDNLVERAQEAAEGAVEKVKQVAGEAADKL